jgi:hypothetical protein
MNQVRIRSLPHPSKGQRDRGKVVGISATVSAGRSLITAQLAASLPNPTAGSKRPDLP